MKNSTHPQDRPQVGVSPATVAHIGQLANLEISAAEQKEFSTAFSETLDEVQRIFSVDTDALEPAHHVSGLVNVWREDVIDSDRVLSQAEALSQAPHTFQGMVVVDRVLEEDTA